MTPPPWPRTHRDVLQGYYNQYDEDIRTGRYHPALYPQATLGALVVIIYLLIDHRNRPWLRNLRFVVWLCFTGTAAYTIAYTRAKNTASALGLGLISAWGVIYIGAFLVVHDAQTDFQRIERTEGMFGVGKKQKQKEMNSEDSDVSQTQSPPSNGSADKTLLNGTADNPQHLGPSRRHGEFAWQPYPLAPFVERLDWVLDLFCNFRGAGWNWRTTSVPPPPKHILDQLRQNSPDPPPHSNRSHAGQPTVHPTRRALLLANAKTFLTGYLVLDFLKTLMMYDPYFWGLVSSPPPSTFPALLTSSPTLTHIYRMTLSMLGVQYAMKTIFSLSPLFFSIALGPRVLGARAQPWMYPDTWGPYAIVLDRGLAGWWSDWWHQTFRFAFEAPSRKLVALAGLDRRKPLAKALQLYIAFALSGFLHASGSVTCAGATNPVAGPLRFFLLQATAILVETLLSQTQTAKFLAARLPRNVKRALTFVYVHIWFYHTAHFLCDDFARGGVWLFEPVPISLFRALGFGVEGEGWNCVGREMVFWVSGDRWWKGGIGF